MVHGRARSEPDLGARVVIYRDIAPQDVPQVDELQRQLFPVRYSEGFYQRLFTDGHYTVLGVTPDGRIIGIASARTVSDELMAAETDRGREGYIMTLGVHESFRRLGVGAELLRRILSVLRSLACTVAALHVKSLNIAACRFYERHGFCPDPAGGWYPGHYLIDGVQYDAYRLVCPLSAGWLEWIAAKLGLSNEGGGAGRAREASSVAAHAAGQQQLHWPLAHAGSSLPPRQAVVVDASGQPTAGAQRGAPPLRGGALSRAWS
ncbi:hypothetical protein KFE25_000053 [Diacronema lutheri]|uniref:N-alpha-acetyltransferase 60 n=1 Tax=Diacronema lutheri TaxID=2081491 RepID=A0A8J5XR23_DIALT|nr:hypothetical protein KFE25_000053 [Diacronema lutheri]